MVSRWHVEFTRCCKATSGVVHLAFCMCNSIERILRGLQGQGLHVKGYVIGASESVAKRTRAAVAAG